MLHVTRPNDAKENRCLHGLTRTLLHNMVVGVTEGYQEGAGRQRRRLPCGQGGQQAGHEPGLLPSGHRGGDRGHHHRGPRPQQDHHHGCDKQQVGQFAAEVREKRPPEPYKGKGIKYTDEVIRRKAGKTGAKK